MKKILVILLVFFLSVQPVNAKDTSFELTDERGMKGETITVKLEINDNPSFGILGATLDYDETKLEYKSSKIIGLDNAFMKDYDIVESKESTGGDLWRIFGQEYCPENLNKLPADTSLQRAYLSWLKQGNAPGSGKGIFFWEGSV